MKTLKPRVAYEGSLRKPRGYSLHQTFQAYSLPWMYDGSRAYMELCSGSIAVLEEHGDEITYRVYVVEGSRCWEQEVESIPEAIGLREDYTELHRLCASDPLLSCIPRSIPGYRLRRLTVWQAILVAVCQQNASFKQGWTMLYNIYVKTGRRVRLGEHTYIATPEPGKLTLEVLREARLGYRARTVMEIVSKGLWRLDCSSVEDLREARGVGDYTLNLVKLLACRDYDSLPVDRWLRALASEAYRVNPRSVENELTRRFNGWRGLAALLTTIAFDAEPLRRALERLKRGENCPGKTHPSPLTLWRYLPKPS